MITRALICGLHKKAHRTPPKSAMVFCARCITKFSTHHRDPKFQYVGIVYKVLPAGCNSKWDKTGRIRKIASALGRPSSADAHSRGHGMAQVALSRAQPSCPHCPPSRSPRARPFTFTSAIARELADRAALTCRFKPLKKTVAIRSSLRPHSVHVTECGEGENPSAIVSLRGVNL